MAQGDWWDPIHVTTSDDYDGCGVGCLIISGGILLVALYLIASTPFCIAGFLLAEKGTKRTDSCQQYVDKTWENTANGISATANFFDSIFESINKNE